VWAVPIHAHLAAREHAGQRPRATTTRSSCRSLESTPEDDAAELTRSHLRLAGVTRPALYTDTATTVQANFRSWRDSGIAWLAISNRHRGEPFAPLPEALTWSKNLSQ
jgi:hypothetical protein